MSVIVKRIKVRPGVPQGRPAGQPLPGFLCLQRTLRRRYNEVVSQGCTVDDDDDDEHDDDEHDDDDE